MQTTFIYALYYSEPVTGARRYFYVGQSKDVARRVQQHRSLETRGHEDKYDFMRTLRSRGASWQAEVLRQVPRAEHRWDHEHWHVIDLTRRGHELRNMRHGDKKKLRELAAMVQNPLIRSATDVRREREQRAGAAGARSKRLRRQILHRTLASRGIADLDADGAILPPRLRARLSRQGIQSIERGVDLAAIIRVARPSRETRELFAK